MSNVWVALPFHCGLFQYLHFQTRLSGVKMPAKMFLAHSASFFSFVFHFVKFIKSNWCCRRVEYNIPFTWNRFLIDANITFYLTVSSFQTFILLWTVCRYKSSAVLCVPGSRRATASLVPGPPPRGTTAPRAGRRPRHGAALSTLPRPRPAARRDGRAGRLIIGWACWLTLRCSCTCFLLTSYYSKVIDDFLMKNNNNSQHFVLLNHNKNTLIYMYVRVCVWCPDCQG